MYTNAHTVVPKHSQNIHHVGYCVVRLKQQEISGESQMNKHEISGESQVVALHSQTPASPQTHTFEVDCSTVVRFLTVASELKVSQDISSSKGGTIKGGSGIPISADSHQR